MLLGWYTSKAGDIRLRVGVIEALKLLLAIGPLSLRRGEAGLLNQLKTWSLRAALATTVLPALIYILQNLLNNAAVLALDGVTFNVLNQTKIIWTALLVYLLLGVRQSPLQLIALALLCVAAILMTTSYKTIINSKERKADADEFTGVYQALLGAVLSALAGSIIQRALQNKKRDQYMVTVELSVLGEMMLLALTFVQDGIKPSRMYQDSHESLWDGWSVMTLGALMCQALGGVLVGFVIRDCGNVEKGFAVVGGMVLTALLETHFNGKPFGHHAMVAMALTVISTAIYTLNPPDYMPKNDKSLAFLGVTIPLSSFVSKSSHSKRKLSAGAIDIESLVAR